MNETKNILLKLFILLTCAVGWSSGAWAALPASQNWGNSSFTKLGDGNYKFYAPYYMSEPITVTTAGNLSVNYRYTGGSWAFPGVGFDLVDDNGVVKYSTYAPRKVGGGENFTWTINDVAPGSYNIRYMTSRYGNDGDFLGRTDPRGVITVSGTAAAGFTPTITGWTHQGWSPVTSADPGLWEGLSIYNKYLAVANIHTYSSAATAMTGGEIIVVNFQKTSGSANLSVKGVELLDASNKIVAADYRDATVSTTGKYTLNVPADGTYTVRTIVQTATENNVNCAGTITYSTPETWTVKINDGYKLVYNGRSYGNNETVAIDIDTHDYRGITVNAPSTKAVWGPIVDNTNKTITFEISNPVNPQAGKWYKVQVLPTSGNLGANMVDAFNGRIKAQGVKGEYIYVQNAEQPSNRSDYKAIHCFMGMPENEAAAYVYVNYFTNNNILLQHINGRYINHEGKQQTTAQSSSDVLLTRENSGSYAGSYYWNKLQPFSLNDADIAHYFGRSSNSTNNFHTYFTEVNPEEKFDMYRVVMMYEGTSTTVTSTAITYSGSENHGFNSVYHGGYFFFTKDAAISSGNFDVLGDGETITIDPSAKTITVALPLPTITHKRSLYYDKLDATPANKKPGYGHVGTTVPGDDGLVTRGDGIKEQKTSVFEIPVYLAPGTSRELYMPSDKLDYYQRWYNYDTDGLVDQQIMPALYSENFKMYQNGHVSGAINGGAAKGYTDKPRFYLPETALSTEVIGGKTYHKDYPLAMDISRYKDYTAVGDNIIEPTLSQRVIYRVMDAHKIADALKAATDASDWLEKREIIFPTIKRGSSGNQSTGADIVPLNMDLNNYWAYNGSNLVQLTSDSQFSVELDPSSTAQLSSYRRINGTALGGIRNGDFNRGHFVVFTYPQGNKAPDNSVAILNVYFTVGGTKYRLAQFTLKFLPGVEPQVISDVMGKEGEEYKNTRSPNYMKQPEVYGSPIAQMNFDNPRVDCSIPTSLVEHYNQWAGWNLQGQYEFPLDFSMTNYAHGYGNSSGTSRGEYAIKKTSETTGDNKYPYYPVKKYFDRLDGTSEYNEDDDYLIYVDAADQAGQVMSIPVQGNLCAGTRLFVSGWISSNAGSSNPASVILSIVGHDAMGNATTLVSYCPGMLSPWGYRNSDGAQVYTFNPSTNESTTNHVSGNWALWQQIAFSFLLDTHAIETYSSFSMDVYNNCFDSSGGDYLLDNFQIFANPPKGDVDFTTPLCSDKVRHAKIHSDFDMLKNLSGVNESDPTAKITTTYCFLDAELFDTYQEYGMTIADMFEMDDKGNHNLKAMYSDSDPNVKNIINHAFRKALVGSRYTKDSGKDDHGFHTYEIPVDYNSIDPYAYNDSKTEIVYREVDDNGVRRLVFKENVVRGEMEMEPAEVGNEVNHPAYWPYMRPSRTYYLVFSPILATQATVDDANTATEIFGIHESCSFFGKFTTKDPLHIILDNADIEADLPVRAVCNGETAYFSFDMPTMKASKPIVDEAYCISDESLNGKVVPESQGIHHYKYEASFKNNDISGVIKNLPYDWWMGGLKFDNETTYRGTIEDYHAAKHPTIVYNHDTADPSHTHTHDADYKKHQEPVDISLAMEDFRFFYPDFKEGDDWGTLQVHDYDNDSGYSLLQSEINAIRDLVEKGIIVLHRNTYDMPLTYEEAEMLQAKELNDMMEKEMNDHILDLALVLNSDPAVAALLPLKALEGTVLDKLSLDGKKRLTFEEFGSFTRDQLVDIAGHLQTQKSKLTELTSEQINAMPEGDLRRVVESALRELPDDEMLGFAKDYFPNIGHEKRAYLVVRALNILSRETVAALSPEDQQNSVATRQALRNQMISIFSAQDPVVLRKMWDDVSAKLTEEERTALLKDSENPETPKNPATMNADDLAVLVEDGLAQLTNNVINDMKSDRYVHFTLIPIMPSQETFVDEQYIFCPEPRGVKVRITSHEPKMLDGFADMPYPEDMENVPVRLGLKQISESKASAAKTLRIPVRGLKQAAKNGIKAVKLDVRTGYYNEIFLVETDDPQYQQTETTGMAEAKNTDGVYSRMIGTIEGMIATYPTALDKTPNNYLVVKFKDDMNFREGYTYRVGINFMEHDSEGHETISCPGEMRLDMKIVPEYQKWTADVNSDWTDDQNWARADRDELNADNAATGSVIAGSTDITVAANYPTNEANKKSSSFVPMYFTNVLVDGDAVAPVLYTVTAASRGEKKFLQGLTSDDATQAQHIYDMEVAPSTGAWHDDNNYECTLFGTYVANGITFKPGSQLINAQHLTYNKAWVEYELQAGRWYTLSSPLQNTFAGEWYSPTNGGKQLTPHFYDIIYQQGGGSQQLNDRFRPAYYQRSWDNGGNNVVYTKSNTDSDNYAYYIAADWSYVYNDVKKEDSNGAFSVMAETGFMGNVDAPADGKVLVRLPKADTGYTYFDVNSETGHKEADVLPIYTKNEDGSITLNQDANPSKLFTDKLKNASSFTQTITNETEGNNFFLVANPFMANMDMDEFFAANSEKIEPKFWIMTANGQEVSVRTETGWVSTSDQVATLGKSAPLQGFFVKGKTNSKSVEITYTAAMQAESTATAPLQARPMTTSNNQTLTINAQYGDITSTAIVAINGGASTDFVSTEDCETFIDSNIADLPTIYTVASGQAMTVNSVPAIDMLPLGIVSETDDNVEVSFSGFEGTLYLYDAQLKTTQTLTDGMTVAMPTNTSGRYFITVDPSTTGITTTTADLSSRKGVWTLSGKYCGTAVKNLAPGVYVVDGVKMVVR